MEDLKGVYGEEVMGREKVPWLRWVPKRFEKMAEVWRGDGEVFDAGISVWSNR